MLLFIASISIIYAFACLWLCYQWLNMASDKKLPQKSEIYFSVIVAVRNEAENIENLLLDLSKQSLNRKYFEVIIANDASTDDTEKIVVEFIKNNRNSLNIKLLTLTESGSVSPKKRAINEAIGISKATHIITTDGDCRLPTQWLETYYNTFKNTQAKFVSGPVTFFEKPNTFFTKLQVIEFASLIGTGGCLIAAQMPTMCNGANLGYEQAAFDAVGGFAGTDHIASGDDELLLQKMAKQYPNGIVFLQNKEAIVQTAPQPTLPDFYHQRVRWASKWAVNKRLSTMTVAIFVFLVNLGLLISAFWFVTNNITIQAFLFVLALKLLPEFLFLSLIMKFLGKQKYIFYIPIMQFLYPFYSLIFGILAQRRSYVWKNRQLH